MSLYSKCHREETIIRLNITSISRWCHVCMKPHPLHITSWWRHQMETFSALLVIYVGNSPVPGEFPTQRPVTRSFDVFFDLHLNKRLSKQSWCRWFETPSRSLWRHRNAKRISNIQRKDSSVSCCQLVLRKCYSGQLKLIDAEWRIYVLVNDDMLSITL